MVITVQICVTSFYHVNLELDIIIMCMLHTCSDDYECTAKWCLESRNTLRLNV